MKKNNTLLERVGFAWAGIVSARRREPNFRLQLAAAVALLLVLAWLQPPTVWWVLCLVMAFLVLAAELFNTALESLIDHLHPEIHPAIKTAKDCAAGAVLLVSVAALMVGVMTLVVTLF